MQQLSITYTREHENAIPTVTTSSIGFEDDDLFGELLAARRAYQQLKKQYASKLEADGVSTGAIVDLMEAL